MIILSGGANGSDMLFGSLGYVTYVFSFVGHKPCYPKNGKVVIVPNGELTKRFNELDVVIKRLRSIVLSLLLLLVLLLITKLLTEELLML